MSEPERRLTPTERLHDIAHTLAERQRPADRPDFGLEQKQPNAEQVKMGIAAVFQWHVNIPVCDEFPTSDQAFNAMMIYGDELRARYGPAMPDLHRELERTMQAIDKTKAKS